MKQKVRVINMLRHYINDEENITLLDMCKEIARQNSIEYNSTLDLLEKVSNYIFDFDYPYFIDESNTYYSKENFQMMFLKHFYKEELFENDIEDWKLELDQALNLVMPYYVELLKSEQWFDKYIKNPAANTDWQEEYKASSNATSKNTGNENYKSNDKNTSTNSSTTNNNASSNTSSNNTSKGGSKNWTGNNDLPKTDLLNDETSYLTSTVVANSTSKSKADSNSNSSSTSKEKQIGKGSSESTNKYNRDIENETNDESSMEYKIHKWGNIGTQTPGEVFENTRKAFINTVREIFKDVEIASLFILVH